MSEFFVYKRILRNSEEVIKGAEGYNSWIPKSITFNLKCSRDMVSYKPKEVGSFNPLSIYISFLKDTRHHPYSSHTPTPMELPCDKKLSYLIPYFCNNHPPKNNLH
jgi:hypothetical protein